MKYLSSFLQEALDPKHAEEVDSWVKKSGKQLAAKSLSEHVFKGKEVLRYPLQETDAASIPIHPDVAGHLEKFGYKIPSGSDYHAGYAVDKHQRVTSIGKALRKTKADPSVVSAFENDPNRTSANAKQLHVSYSWEPHHVASMSTGRGWSSCMNMDGGMNRHYLEHDIKHGTHVAYLTHSDDEKIERPIARIALKPFRSESEDHTILRPENATYGTAKDSFSKHVANWAETHFPAKKDTLYTKPDDLYNDSFSRVANYSTKKIGEALDALHHSPISLSYHDPHRVVVQTINTPENVNHAVNHLIDNYGKDAYKTFDKVISIDGGDWIHNLPKEATNKIVNHLVDNDSTGEGSEVEWALRRSRHAMGNNEVNRYVEHGIKHRMGSLDQFASHAGLTDTNLKALVDHDKDSINYIPDHRIDRHIIDKAHTAVNESSEFEYRGFDNLITSSKFNSDDIDKAFHHTITNKGHINTQFLARKLGDNRNYTLSKAKELDSKYSGHGLTFIHPDVTHSDIAEQYAAGQRVDDSRKFRFASQDTKNAIFKIHPEAIYEHAKSYDTPDHAPYKNLIDAMHDGYVEDKHRAKDFLSNTTHNNIPISQYGEPHQHNAAKDRIKNALKKTVQAHSHLPEMHDAIHQAVHNAANEDDPLLAQALLHTAKIKNVPLKRSTINHVNAVSAKHDYNPFHESGATIING